MNAKISKLISDISIQCVDNKINFNLSPSQYVEDCSGYFDGNNLVVATGKENLEDWVIILVHESCHMDQFLEKSPYWYDDEIALNPVDKWLKKKHVPKKKLVEAFKNTISMELDCEKRAIKKIKKYKLPFSTLRYIQKANSYLFAYQIAYKTRKWFKAAYEKPDIYNNMPKKLLTVDDYFDSLSPYLKLYK